MRRLLPLLPLCLVGGCYYGPYGYDGYYGYRYPYPPAYTERYAPGYQQAYPPQGYAPTDQSGQSYGQPGYTQYQAPADSQSYGQPTYLTPQQEPGQSVYQGGSQGQPYYGGAQQPGYASPANCDTPDRPQGCY